MTRSNTARSESTGATLIVPGRPDARITLRGVRLTSRVGGMSQRTTLEQTFINSEPVSVEAVYTFPLPEQAAVCGFEVLTGERVLTGRIEEAEKGIDQYEQAVGQGHGAFMLEQERPDVFTVRVGSLKPKQAVTIRISYVCLVEKVDRSIRLAFPTTMAPRYVSDAGMDPLEAMVDGEALNPPHLLHVPYGLSMEVLIDLARPIKGVSSPSHAISVEKRGAHAWREVETTRVTLAARTTEMNREIVLLIDLLKEQEPCVQTETDSNGSSYLAVTFVPEFETDTVRPAPSETIFVLDCSGSMQGESIQQATTALELCLRALDVGDTFNVCRFGSTFELLASEPLRYSQQTLDRAIACVRRGADLGGTELHAPLEAILREPPVVGSVRQIVLLTDGQITNEPACIELARRNRLHNRIFSFGIGSACSTSLVKGLARATGGAAEFIAPGERIDEKVMRTFARMASPMVCDVAIDWDGAEVQTLAEMPPVFDGDVLAVFGRVTGRMPAKVTLSCMSDAGPRNWTVPVPPPMPCNESAGVIGLMWARRTIQSLEEVNGIGTARSRPTVQSRERDMLIRLSKDFGLLSALTTFIAIEHRCVEDREHGRPAIRRIPVQIAAGWSGTEVPQQVFAQQVFACVPGGALSGGTGLMDLTRESDDSFLLPPVLDEIIPPSATPLPAAQSRAASAGRMRKRSGIGNAIRGLLGASGGSATSSRSPASVPPAPSDAGSRIDKTLDSTSDRAFGCSFDNDIPAEPTRDAIFSLLSDQAADGAFPDSRHVQELLARFSINFHDWRKLIDSELVNVGVTTGSLQLITTVMAIALMSLKFTDREPIWRRAKAKAMRYLTGELGKTTAETSTWLDAVQAKLTDADRA